MDEPRGRARKFATRYPRAAVGLRWIAKAVFYVVAAYVLIWIAFGQDPPQLVQVREDVIGAIGAILLVLWQLPGYMWIAFVIVVPLFLIVQELGHICSHLASLNSSVGAYLEARRRDGLPEE